MNPNLWPANTPVTLRLDPTITGRTKVVTARDGRRFVKIHRDHGGDAGWANAAVWMLGAGPRQARCVDCGQDYRYTAETYGDGFCPGCNHEPTMSTLPETRSVKGSLYGARTPRKPAPVAAAVAEPEPWENPFD